MKSVKSIVALGVIALSVTACFKAPTLEERLAGKSGAERNRELYYACLERSRYSVPGGHTGDYVGHETRMWALCDEMNTLNQPREN